MKYLIFLLLFSGAVYGQSTALNLNIPSTSSNYQSDRFRANNLDCQNAIGSSTNVEFGVVGIINEDNPTMSLDQLSSTKGKDVGVYAKITIPIGAPKKRIDCNELFKLELEARRLEVQQLRLELMQARGRNLEFEN